MAVWAAQGAFKRPAMASIFMVILFINYLIRLTSDLTASRRWSLVGRALPFPRLRRRCRDLGVVGPVQRVQNGCRMWGKRDEEGTVGSGLAGRSLAIAVLSGLVSAVAGQRLSAEAGRDFLGWLQFQLGCGAAYFGPPGWPE